MNENNNGVQPSPPSPHTQLIPMREAVFTDGLQPTVNARDLHTFLEVQTRFNDWIRRRIDEFGFKKGNDFILLNFEYNPQTEPPPATDYHLSLDMAKELCMVERNERGRQARRYFIEAEKRLREKEKFGFEVPQTRADALRLLATHVEAIESLRGENRRLQPKAEFHDKVTAAEGSHTIREAAKILGTGEKRLFILLREKRVLMRSNLPYQQHVDNGRFQVIEKTFDRDGKTRIYRQTMVTGKGMTWLQGAFFGDQQALPLQ